MTITVITGSGHKDSASSYLADEFSKGAKENGNVVFRFDAGLEKVNPCIGCRICRNSKRCVYDDAFMGLSKKILESNIIVWVTPVYYMTMTSQLKTVIDRMYQLETDSRLRSNKKYILIATAWDNNKSVFDVLKDTFNAFCKFLRWEKIDEVLAYGVDSLDDIKNSSYGNKAYLLGKSIYVSEETN